VLIVGWAWELSVVLAVMLTGALTVDWWECCLSGMGSEHFQNVKCIPWSLDRLFSPNEGDLEPLYL
jgi:hypothetical protein